MPGAPAWRREEEAFIVGEAAAPYAAKKPVKGKAVSQAAASERSKAAEAAFKKVADKIFSERKELLHKLAQ